MKQGQIRRNLDLILWALAKLPSPTFCSMSSYPATFQ